MLAHSRHVMTLANSIIGVGILAMPFCFQKCGIILSIILLIVSNWITRVCCHYLIKSSLLTRRKSFELLGFHAFNFSGKLLVELCIIGYLWGTCITYFVVVGDLGPQIVTKMFSLNEEHTHLRIIVMIVVTVVCIIPLGMLKNVDSLSTVCTASVGFYVCMVVKIILESKDHIVANDWTDKVLYWEPAGVLQCLPIFSMALSCQMQLFEVFESINNQSLEKLNGIVRDATWICTCVYIAVGFFGYVAFSTQAFAGNILLNFSPSFGSDVIKIGFILSIAFSFPLVIFPCRASIYSLLYRKGHTDATGYIPETRFKVITVFIVSLSLLIALMIPSVELVIGLVGSTIGVAICVMFPAVCFRKIVRKESTERSLAQIVFLSGFCLMILGTYANLNAIDVKNSGTRLDMPRIEPQLPSELPIIRGEVEIKLKDDLIKADVAQKESEQLKVKEAPNQTESNLEKVLKLEESKNAQSPEPPLPVDDTHEEAPLVVKEALVPKPVETAEKLPPVQNVVVVNKTENKVADAAKVVESSVKNETIANVVQKQQQQMPAAQPQQAIDTDAIKKDEEIAAEELKNNKESKTNEDELKKTQKELKQTKELLERRVDELKEELAKQNQETQNLVVEKLGEVVDKVVEIERNMQQQDNPTLAPAVAIKQEQMQQQEREQKKAEIIMLEKLDKVAEKVQEIEREVQEQKQQQQQQPLALEKIKETAADVQLASKGSIINILKDNSSAKLDVPAAAAAASQQHQVYEPLSYKTGELIEHARNGTNLEQRLPLPLALLINSAQANKRNDSVKLQATKEMQGPHNNVELKEANTKQDLTKANDNQKPEFKQNINETPEELLKAQELEKENVKAIRRDILQVKNTQELNSGTFMAPTAAADAAVMREKRSLKAEDNIDFEAINNKLNKENCLTEPKVKTLLGHGLSNAVIDLQQHLGRSLKALSDKEESA